MTYFVDRIPIELKMKKLATALEISQTRERLYLFFPHAFKSCDVSFTVTPSHPGKGAAF
jgi:hypothetical protein